MFLGDFYNTKNLICIAEFIAHFVVIVVIRLLEHFYQTQQYALLLPKKMN